jgi:hypothetical protein
MSGTSTFRCIAGNVQKIAFLITLWTCIRRYHSSDEKSAFWTFPEGLITLRADILIEFPISGMTTVRTYKFLLFTFHFLYLLSSIIWIDCLIQFLVPALTHFLNRNGNRLIYQLTYDHSGCNSFQRIRKNKNDQRSCSRAMVLPKRIDTATKWHYICLSLKRSAALLIHLCEGKKNSL